MKKHIFALFTTTDAADTAINFLHNELGIPTDDISYIYKNDKGETVEGEGSDVATNSTLEGAESGAITGGVIGAVIGLAAVAGIAGPLGTIVAAGPLASALGLTGALGATAGAALMGAAAGGLIGALANMGLGEPKAKAYQDRIFAGDILVTVSTTETDNVVAALLKHGASDIEVVEANV